MSGGSRRLRADVGLLGEGGDDSDQSDRDHPDAGRNRDDDEGYPRPGDGDDTGGDREESRDQLPSPVPISFDDRFDISSTPPTQKRDTTATTAPRFWRGRRKREAPAIRASTPRTTQPPGQAGVESRYVLAYSWLERRQATVRLAGGLPRGPSPRGPMEHGGELRPRDRLIGAVSVVDRRIAPECQPGGGDPIDVGFEDVCVVIHEAV